jgi:hypothetical protein
MRLLETALKVKANGLAIGALPAFGSNHCKLRTHKGEASCLIWLFPNHHGHFTPQQELFTGPSTQRL